MMMRPEEVSWFRVELWLPILVEHVAAKGWCKNPGWLSLNNRGRLACGSSLSVPRAHAVHFRGRLPLIGQLWAKCGPAHVGHIGGSGHAAAVWPVL